MPTRYFVIFYKSRKKGTSEKKKYILWVFSAFNFGH